MGWQFALAEFVGGAIMIVLFVLLAPRVFPAAELEQARQRLTAGVGRCARARGHGDARRRPRRSAGRPFRQRLRSRAGWADAAGYTVSDLTMLRRELVIGYLVAGFLAVAVPASVYSTVFISGHGLLTDLENVVVGPFIAFISFVCSVGNVPLAAALYEGGISFGGTVAFIFADLIALPLVVIYGKFYGRRLAVRLFLSFWAVMSVAGLAVDLLFRAVGHHLPRPQGRGRGDRLLLELHDLAGHRLPRRRRARLLDLPAAGAARWGRRPRQGPGLREAGRARERPAPPPPHDGRTVYFCSDRCLERFTREPERYAAGAPAAAQERPTDDAQAVDPVCGMTVDPATAADAVDLDGEHRVFCSPGCAAAFRADPDRYRDTARPGAHASHSPG